MTIYDILQVLITLGALVALTPPLGRFMARVFQGERTWLSPLVGPVERLTYRAGGVNPAEEMSWKRYAGALLLFNLLGFLVVFGLQMLQKFLPLNPQGLANVSWHSAFNTAVSFMTNTNWQGYAGETTMSYLTQMAGLTVQNFVSAATGMAVALALIRGITRRSMATIGNFWADMVRTTLYILLPLAVVWTLVLISQGTVQTFDACQTATTLEGTEQVIALGPAASQIAIKQLGTNGGGFFNSNSSVPFENPSPISNWFETLAILLIPSATVYMYGVMSGSRRHGWIVYAAMMILLLVGLGVSLYSEFNATHAQLGTGSGPILEGKEARFGVTNSVIWSTFTTAASNGSVNAMHSSLTPLAGGIAMFNIMLGGIIFGGVGAGLYGMLLFVLLTVFLAGLMVGRTPEYFGKKIESGEIKMVILAIIAPAMAILIGSAVSVVAPSGLSSLANKGPHGLSEILYAFSSAAGNNGSAFAGLSANTPWYNILLGLAMLIGRFAVILPALAIAGSLAVKKSSPPSPGTFATDSGIFLILLLGIIIIVGALTFFPALSLGPIVEHFLMQSGRTF
ncbi:MAG: potassium-transporting ATPase subunit KdpA [Candidatus Zixiibacteriota bacterium]